MSGAHVFPEDIQTTMKPYFDRADFSHHLNPGTAETVEEQEVRVMVEPANGESYHIQDLNEERYYVSHINQASQTHHTPSTRKQRKFSPTTNQCSDNYPRYRSLSSFVTDT